MVFILLFVVRFFSFIEEHSQTILPNFFNLNFTGSEAVIEHGRMDDAALPYQCKISIHCYVLYF